MSAGITLKSLRWGSIVIILVAFFFMAANYMALPDQIPIHYNHRGEIDNYGPKSYLWIMPVLAAVMCYGMIQSNQWIQKITVHCTQST